MSQIYDRIGDGYLGLRVPDHRIAREIMRALGESETVVNVGAGTGSYEPSDRPVVAVEPSLTMIRQRLAGNAPVLQASATELPLKDNAFDAALAVLTVHHWPDQSRGLAELARVARRKIVILTWDPDTQGFWLTNDYFPAIAEIDRQILPQLGEFRKLPGQIDIHPLLVPHDCTDGFLGAYWRRPHAYLDPVIRGAMSTFSKIPDVESGLGRLRRDLEDNTWQQKYGHLLRLSELDLGYRLVIVDLSGETAYPTNP
jgi:SAM-dependent methyltransferase